MGLAAPKNRTKISRDPNNTKWSRNTERFGHKILTAQGWTPGNFLGAEDAPHAEHYGAANASHIRVSLRDGNGGLGWQKGKSEGGAFGLAALQGLLGRLNGKSDTDLKKEEKTRKDVATKFYFDRRYGGVNFVFGGYLVGDKIEEDLEKGPDVASETGSTAGASVTDTGSSAKETSSKKKRKRDEETATDEEQPRLRRKKRKSDLRSRVLEAQAQEAAAALLDEDIRMSSTEAESSASGTSTPQLEPSSVLIESSSVARKEEKRKRKLEKRAKKEERRKVEGGSVSVSTSTSTSTSASASASSDEKEEKKRRKAEKQAKKAIKAQAKELSTPSPADEREDKRKRKLEKQAKKEAKRLDKEKRRRDKSRSASVTPSQNVLPTSFPLYPIDETPELTPPSTTNLTSQTPAVPRGGRHFVRQRYIRQKQMAAMDPQSLKEIFMLKAQA